MRVYLDICAIQRPLDDHAQLRVRLEVEAVLTLIELCENGALELVTSAAHDIENGQNPYEERKAHAADVLALSRYRQPSDEAVAHLTTDFVAAGLTQLDAFHLAAAVASGASFFCTTDDRLVRIGRSTDTKSTSVVSPLDLVLQLDLP